MRHKRFIGNLYEIISLIILVTITLCGVVITFLSAYFYYQTSNSGFLYAIVFIGVLSSVLIFVIVASIPSLFVWYEFTNTNVIVKPLFCRKYSINYSSCHDVGVISISYNISPSGVRRRETFIFLSTDYLKKKDRLGIHNQKVNKQFVKCMYRKDTFDYLTTVLPKQQKNMLQSCKDKIPQKNRLYEF